jgi:prevent-host-death family protein
MKKVNVAKLKAELSAHLQLVKQGEEVLVCERNKPVARIVPYVSDDWSEHEQRLIAEGVLVPPRSRGSKPTPLPEPVGNVSREVMERIWEDVRGDR